MNNKDSSLPHLLSVARQAAIEAGAAILDIYETDDFGVEAKADNSPLTRADRAAHDLIAQHLLPLGLPLLSEEGEQTPYDVRKKWEWYWLVDPLDGTKEFIKRNGEFTVNIALMHGSQPVGGVVLAPVIDALYWGSAETGVWKEEAGQREQLFSLTQASSMQTLLRQPEVTVIASRSHRTPETEAFIGLFRQVRHVTMGSSLKLMLLAENKAHIYPRFAPTMEWDTAAAHALLGALNRGVYQTDLQTELAYNKPNLLNPSFVAF